MFHFQSPKEVRFSLEGLVIPRDMNVPTYVGLHHHGDEPEVRELYCTFV